MSTALAQPPVALGDGEGERISFGGVEITFKSPRGKEDGWTVLDYRLPARQFGAVLHYHNAVVESFYILEGEVWFRIGDEEITRGPGGFAFVPAGILHSFANHSDAPAHVSPCFEPGSQAVPLRVVCSHSTGASLATQRSAKNHRAWQAV